MKYFFTSAYSTIFSFLGKTLKSFFSTALSDVYFHASSFLVGKPLVSKFFMASVRTSCKSESTSTRSSKAMKEDNSFSFKSILVLRFNPVVTFFFKFKGKFFTARFHDLTVVKYVYKIRNNIVKKPLVV